MLAVLSILALNAVVAPVLYRWLGRFSFYVLALPLAASFLLLLGMAVTNPGSVERGSWPWIQRLGISLALRMDALSLILSLLITGVGALVLAYCAQYFAKAKRDSVGHAMFAGQLSGFAAAMFLLVSADDLILLAIAWEATSILSYLMVSFSRTRLSARRAALQALIVTTAGGLAMLAGFLMLAHAASSMSVSVVIQALAEQHIQMPGPYVAVAAVLVFAGAATKSALVPVHFWLPGAMTAPTPVSAYLHAAAMVKAGIYLLARFSPGFWGVDAWQWCVVILGSVTMLVGGYRALRQYDLKLILAYGTVSQLGLLALTVGTGIPDIVQAGVALMMAHALFKASLFLIVGIIDHQSGTRDIRELAGLARRAPILFAAALIASASMAGVPLTFGFVTKEVVLTALLDAATTPLGRAAMTAAVLGSVLTVAYTTRFMTGAFGDGRFFNVSQSRYIYPISASFALPPLLLSALGLFLGLFPGWVDPLVYIAGEQAAALNPRGEKLHHLLAWYGFKPAFFISAAVILAGLALSLNPRPVSRFQDWLSGGPVTLLGNKKRPDAERAFRAGLGVLDEVAVWVTGRTQRGSVRFYLSIILTVAVLLPLTALVLGGGKIPSQWHLADSGAQIVCVVIIIVAALAATKAKKRFLAVLLISVTGYGLSVLFALQGAPDLALTQLLVETILTVGIVLALRVLPKQMDLGKPAGYRLFRILLGSGFGLAMMLFAAVSMASRSASPISLKLPDLAYKGGGGANIVNVTLVDIRAWDTFGEVALLTIAATGVASLIFISGRGDRQLQTGFSTQIEPGSTSRGKPFSGATRFSENSRQPWMIAGHTLDADSRSVMLEIVVRLIFPSLMMISAYLLVAGHNQPGGGFAAGIMAGLALTARYFAGGRYELYEAMPISAGTMLGWGLAVIALCATVPLFFGGYVLQSAIISTQIPFLGELKFVTSTLFDIGVLLIVVGLVADVLRGFGSRLDWLASRQERDLISSDSGSEASNSATTQGGRS